MFRRLAISCRAASACLPLGVWRRTRHQLFSTEKRGSRPIKTYGVQIKGFSEAPFPVENLDHRCFQTTHRSPSPVAGSGYLISGRVYRCASRKIRHFHLMFFLPQREGNSVDPGKEQVITAADFHPVFISKPFLLVVSDHRIFCCLLNFSTMLGCTAHVLKEIGGSSSGFTETFLPGAVADGQPASQKQAIFLLQHLQDALLSLVLGYIRPTKEGILTLAHRRIRKRMYSPVR